MFSITRKIGASAVDGCQDFTDCFNKAIDTLEDMSIDDWSPLVLWFDNLRIAEATRGLCTWIRRANAFQVGPITSEQVAIILSK